MHPKSSLYNFWGALFMLKTNLAIVKFASLQNPFRFPISNGLASLLAMPSPPY